MIPKLKKDEYIKIYTYMLKIRRFEERAAQLYGMGHIGGFCHLYIGQEAVVVGVLMTIDNNDSVVTTYRDHGHMIARGLDPKKIMAELTGRADGYSAGIGGVWIAYNVDMLPVSASMNAPVYDELYRVLFIIGAILFIGMTALVI